MCKNNLWLNSAHVEAQTLLQIGFKTLVSVQTRLRRLSCKSFLKMSYFHGEYYSTPLSLRWTIFIWTVPLHKLRAHTRLSVTYNKQWQARSQNFVSAGHQLFAREPICHEGTSRSFMSPPLQTVVLRFFREILKFYILGLQLGFLSIQLGLLVFS